MSLSLRVLTFSLRVHEYALKFPWNNNSLRKITSFYPVIEMSNYGLGQNFNGVPDLKVTMNPLSNTDSRW